METIASTPTAEPLPVPVLEGAIDWLLLAVLVLVALVVAGRGAGRRAAEARTRRA